MPFSLRKHNNDVVGLDIDGAYLAAAQVDGGSIGRVASVDLMRGIADDGEVKDPEALTEALKDMFKRFTLPRSVRLGVANAQIVVRHLDMPLIENDKERDSAVRFQAAEAIAMPLEEAVLDYQPVGAGEAPDGTVRQRILVVAARKSMIERLVGAVKAAGLKPMGIDLNAFAMVRMLAGADSLDTGAELPNRVLCHLGGVTNLAIASGPVCVFTRSLSTVWAEGDESAASSLAEEIRLSIDYHMAQPQARPASEIILSGPGALDGELASALQARIGLPVSVAEPLGRLGTHTVPSGDDPYRYTVAAGLAMGAAA
jgi:type IV pilus assembly protein PilM